MHVNINLFVDLFFFILFCMSCFLTIGFACVLIFFNPAFLEARTQHKIHTNKWCDTIFVLYLILYKMKKETNTEKNGTKKKCHTMQCNIFVICVVHACHWMIFQMYFIIAYIVFCFEFIYPCILMKHKLNTSIFFFFFFFFCKELKIWLK